MNYAVALASLVLFIIAFRYANIVGIASDAMARARGAVAVLADRGKSEAEKERAARAAAIVLFGRFFLIVALTAAAILPSALVLAAAAWFGLASESAVMDALLSPALIAAAIALFVLDYMIRR